MELSEDDIRSISTLLVALKNHQHEKVKEKVTNRWRDLNAEDLDLVVSESFFDIDIIFEDNCSYDGSKIIHTLFSYSVTHSTPEIVRLLLAAYELNPNIPLSVSMFDIRGNNEVELFEPSDITALILAIKEGKYEMAKILLEFGANSSGSWKALGEASINNSRSTEDQFFSLLVRHGTDVHHGVFEYLSGLHIDTEDFEQALQEEDLLPRIDNAICRLKKIGATLSSSKPGENSIHIATMHPALLKCLQKYFPLEPVRHTNVPPVLLGHICPTTINILTKSGHDITEQDIFGNNLLHHWASEMCLADFGYPVDEVICSFEQILATGITVDERNHRGQTPLHFAALRKSSTAIEMLLRAGANPHIKDENGLLPFAYALISRIDSFGVEESNYYEIFADQIQEENLVVEKLLSKGIDLNSITSNEIALIDLIATATDSIFFTVLKSFDSQHQDDLRIKRAPANSKKYALHEEMQTITVAGYLYHGDTNVVATRL